MDQAGAVLDEPGYGQGREDDGQMCLDGVPLANDVDIDSAPSTNSDTALCAGQNRSGIHCTT